MTKRTYSIGDTAKITATSVKQLRYWEGKYIPVPDRIVCGERSYRRYSERDIWIILELKSYLDQGFSLSAAAEKVQSNHHY